MKPRHTSAVLLVGWYLMAPPPISQDGRVHRMSDWTVIGAFRTEKDCDAKLGKLSKIEPTLDSYPHGLPPEEIYQEQCIATDNPRLAKRLRAASAR